MTLASARQALQSGRLMEAVDEAGDLLGAQPRDPEALYVKALALSRLGASSVAADTLHELLAQEGIAAALRAEALALRGRLLKDRGAHREASAAYEQAHRLAPAAFFAVNAATLQRLAGALDASRALAGEAMRLATGADHWDAATRGECALLLGDTAAARRHYREAARLAGRRYGDAASMRRQLRLLQVALPDAAEALEEIPAPMVVAFTGHMIDAPGRAKARFPAALEPAVADAIARWLERSGDVVGHSQAACGADILFLEALQARGHETHVTLPCATQDYVTQSVSFAGGGWEARFRRALESATSVTHATAEAYLGDQVLFEHASRFIDGRVVLRARELQGEAAMLAVLDAGAEAAVGGTRRTFDEWLADGRRGEAIDLAALRLAAGLDGVKPAAAAPQPDAAPPARLGRRICGIVFCDVRGYSKLSEEYSPRFQERFLGEARAVIDSLGEQFRTAQSAGDGIYATFASAAAAAEFSLALRDRVGAIDWTGFGMPRDAHVRVAVHCGPAFPIDDPVTGQPNFCGTHVNRTARIEPVVTPGQVFGTEAVAAYLALRSPGIACDYLGVLALAKGYGSLPLYRLRRAGAPG